MFLDQSFHWPKKLLNQKKFQTKCFSNRKCFWTQNFLIRRFKSPGFEIVDILFISLGVLYFQNETFLLGTRVCMALKQYSYWNHCSPNLWLDISFKSVCLCHPHNLVTSHNILKRSETSSDSTDRLLERSYLIFWCSSSKCNENGQSQFCQKSV